MKPPPAVPGTTRRVGRYEIVREVGRGGMAVVYLARQTDLDRRVALKELGGLHAADPLAAQRFVREARMAGSLSHPNIVGVHDYFEHDGTPYIAMEYIERGSLRPYVGKLDLAQIGGVLEGVLAGLMHAEKHGLVHRDLKPENVMVTGDGRVKIADFGIAKASTQVGTGYLTATGTAVGAPNYMAPEQAMAQDVGPWTDLYSVGCMAFELFTGHVPFHETSTPVAVLLHHINNPIPSIRDVQPDVDVQISEWADRLLVTDPAHRTRSGQAAWEELEEILLALLGPRWRHASLLTRTGEHPAPPAPDETGNGSARDEFVTVDRSTRSPVRKPSLAPPPPPPPPPPTVYPRAGVPPPRTVSQRAVPPPPAPVAWQRPPSVPAPAPPPTSRPQTTDHAPPVDEPPPVAVDEAPPVTKPVTRRVRTDQRSPRRLLLAVPLVAGVCALLVVVNALLPGGERPSPTAPPPSPAASTPGILASGQGMSLTTPSGWTQADSAPDVSGLRDGSVSVEGPEGARVIFGRADRSADNPSLLPADVRESARDGAVASIAENVDAYRYDNVPLGAETGTVFAVPTSRGVAMLVCLAGADTCIEIASSWRITGATPLPLGPDTAYTQRLTRALSTLKQRRAAATSDLHRAGRRPGQVAASAQARRRVRRDREGAARADDEPGRRRREPRARRGARRGLPRIRQGESRGIAQGRRRLPARGTQRRQRPPRPDRHPRGAQAVRPRTALEHRLEGGRPARPQARPRSDPHVRPDAGRHPDARRRWRRRWWRRRRERGRRLVVPSQPAPQKPRSPSVRAATPTQREKGLFAGDYGVDRRTKLHVIPHLFRTA